VKLLTLEAQKFNFSIVGLCTHFTFAMFSDLTGLFVSAFGEDVPKAIARYLRLSTPRGAEASPVTPTSGRAWE
jgi:hypothetical protein